MTDRRYILQVDGAVRGRFHSRFDAQNELWRLEQLSRKRGNPPGSVLHAARIVVEPERD